MTEKRKRSTAKGRFTRAVNCMEKYMDGSDGDEENAVQYFNDVEKAWRNMEEKHEEYIITLEDDTIDAEEKWISDVQNTYHDVRSRYVKFKNSCQVKSELLSKEKSRCVIHETFSRLLENLKSSATNNYPCETIQRERIILDKQFELVKGAHAEFCLLSDKTAEPLNNQWLENLISQFGAVNSIADSYLKTLKSESVSKTENLGKDNIETKPGNFRSKMKMEQMPLPKFYGEARFYRRFKRDFEELVLPQLDPREAAFTLRQCLGQNVSNILGSGDYDLNQIFKRLDEKYGDPTKMVDSIITEIQRFRKIENDDTKRLIDFINLIERASHDLDNVKMGSEINNTNVVSMIESKLPKCLALNWYRHIHSSVAEIDRSKKFPSLLKYMITERNALEYGQSDLRLFTERKIVSINHVKVVKCLIHKDDSHNTSECSSYLSYTIDQRFDLLKSNRACFSCLSGGHLSFDCRNRIKCIVDNCGWFHHVSLHKPAVSFGNESVNTLHSPCPSDSSGSSCIFPIMRIRVGNTSLHANVLWDCCASICLITEAKANELKLQGNPSEISLTVVGGVQRSIQSMRYKVPLVDLQGRTFVINAHSINTISSNIQGLEFSNLRQFFPKVNIDQLVRPKGEVDILIGYNYAAWHPIPENVCGHLIILSNSFGKCIAGSHPNICEKTTKNESISYIVNLVSVKNVISNFSMIEALGTEFNPPCGSCKCGNCPLGGKNCTIKEEKELALIDSKLKYSEEGFWVAGYPWVADAKNLPNNRSYAFNLLLQIEKRLKRDPNYAKSYTEQMQDMLTRNVARKLTEKEIMNYQGPVHYIAHHAVLKPSSKSTPIRIVFNSSANFKGHILNEYWAKGPNVFLNTLFGILIRFRENLVGFMGDISKMYNSVRIPVFDQHCHRFLWRDMNLNKSPDTYVITRVNMGDRPSGSMASLALRKTAEMKAIEYPHETKVILTSSYMDDIIDSTETAAKAKQITNNITNILKTGDFHIKHWVIASDTEDFDDCKLFPFLDGCERVLGMFWSVNGDIFRYTVKLNFSKKRGNTRIEPDLTIDEIDFKIPQTLSKRMILSQLNGIFDPLGLVSPFVIKGKMLLRQLFRDKIGWDEKISDELRAECVSFFREMFDLPLLSFKRSVKPVDAVKEPTLIIFSDASKEAYGACCYIRWELADGAFSSNILLSKSKIAPVKVITIVRLELLAAVISVRLRLSIKVECRYNFERIIHIVDSEIVRAMIQRESYGFNTFTSTKIGEIQGGSIPEDWYWVNGDDNVADLLTRGEEPVNLNVGSTWQRGPEFLNLPFEEWPVRQDCSIEVLPEQKETIMHVKLVLEEIIRSDRFSKFIRLVRVTARVLSVLVKPFSFKNISQSVTVEKYDKAVCYWVRESQKPMLDNLKNGSFGKGCLRKICPVMREDGVYVIGGRAERWFEASFNKRLIPILPKNHNFSKLYAEMIHGENHSGIDSDISKIRLNYWIVGLRQICKSINTKCVDCRKQRLKLSSQIMGKLPIERLKPAPAWNSVGVDLFGPFEIRGEVNKRTTGKAYGVIFFCLPSTAVYLDIATDYSTDAFLMVLRKFVSLRGCPSNIYSDSGTQLVGASNILKSISQDWNWEEIEDFGVSKGINWNFSPGDAPWWNGCCESLIKSIKKSIWQSVKSHRVSFSELQTIVFEAANLANERPIGIKPDGNSEHSYLCPNDLLLGRASQRAPHGTWDQSNNIAKRFNFVQQIVDLYWKKWTLCYFPNLILQHKWHHEKRNVQVGDIIMIADKHLKRGEWKLGKISRAELGIDRKVRRVTIMYKNKGSNIFTEIERPVQRIVVILPVDEYTVGPVPVY